MTTDPLPSPALNDCGCCEGVSVEIPSRIENRPGLSAIAYRIGTHPTFKATLLARLTGSRQPALAALTTRDTDDFTIAFLDACAVVGDVLTFYQERIANETYLRTAAERLSILELARLIDYQLRPGVAASTYLAFTLEDAPGALGQALSVGTTAQSSAEPLPPITIAVGVKAQSVPGPGEQAQTFETVEAIDARPAWNAMRPRLTRPQDDAGFLATSVIVKGAATGIKAGDSLLIESGTTRTVRTVQVVTPNDGDGTTRLDFISQPASLPGYTETQPVPDGSLNDFQTTVELTDSVVRQVLAATWKAEDLEALIETQGWSETALTAAIEKKAAEASLPKVYLLRQQVGVFGNNAPAYISLIKPDGTALYPHPWDPDFEIWKNPLSTGTSPAYYTKADVYLERPITGVAADSYVVLLRDDSTDVTILRVAAIRDAAIAGFGMSGKVSALDLKTVAGVAIGNNTTDKPAHFKVRGTTLLLQAEELSLAELPIDAPISGDTITLDGLYLGLRPGQRVVLTGDRSDLVGVAASELRSLEQVYVVDGFTVVKLDDPLEFIYVRQQPSALGQTERRTVTINANVALATHGQTVPEVLGSGDANQPFQRFTLRQPPLTYVSASTPSGGETTLEVRVNDVLWHEVTSFFGHGPEERIYITRLDDDGKTTVIFGDGRTGARLPTGQENVRAVYRKGIGLGGVLDADRLTQLMDKPLGVRSVTNPLPATGAADPEQRDDARRNAPLTVMTLGRVVSLRDYEDFARAFSGIGKALATWTWFGETRGVFVTIAGSDGADVDEDSTLFGKLVSAMRTSGDERVPLVVKSYQSRLFRVSADVRIDPDYLPETVAAEVDTALRAAFSFSAREFGQPVHFSEVVGVIQNVEGVVSVDVNELYRSDLTPGAEPEPHIPAAAPQAGSTGTTPAELLTIDPRTLDIEVHT